MRKKPSPNRTEALTKILAYSIGGILLVLSTVLNTVACQPSPNIPPRNSPQPESKMLDNSWLNSIPCHPPCWEGITPGQTSVSEALQILRENPKFESIKTGIDPGAKGRGYIIWKWKENENEGEISFDPKLQDPTISLIRPGSSPINLGEVIAGFGEPTHAIGRAIRGPHLGEVIYNDLSIVYAKDGILLADESLPTGPHPNWSSATKFSVYFFNPTPDGIATATMAIGETPERLVPWEGMRDFEFYCRDGLLCKGEIP